MTGRIRIGHVTQSIGGVETYILTILDNLGRDRFAHTVICPGDTSLAARARQLGAEVVPVGMVRDVRPISDLASFVSVVRALRKSGVDVVHAHSGKGGALGRLAGFACGLPVAFTPNAFSHLSGRGLGREALLGTERILARLPRGGVLVASSESEADRAVREVGWPASRVRRDCPNAIAPTAFARGRREPGPVRVLAVTRLAAQKDPLRLVRVAGGVVRSGADVSFAVVGARERDEHLVGVGEAIAAAGLADRVRLVPWSDATDVRRHYEAADICFTAARYEGLPFALLDALDAELPVVATDVDGNRDAVVHGVTGYLAATDDALVEAVLALAADGALRLAMGQAGKRLLRERFDVARTMPILGEIYRQLANA